MSAETAESPLAVVCALTTCDVEFTPRKRGQTCCSEVHGKKRWHERLRLEGRTPPRRKPSTHPCVACGEILTRKHGASEFHMVRCRNAMCRSFVRTGRWPSSTIPSRHPVTRKYELKVWVPRVSTWALDGPRFVAGLCGWCDKPFVFDRLPSYGGTVSAQWCSPRCSAKHAKYVRRIRIRAGRVEVVRPTRVFDRDRWTCQICRKRLSRRPVPHPLAATLDHIIPVADDGDHSYANLRAAHYRCNSVRGDRGGPEQLALIG